MKKTLADYQREERAREEYKRRFKERQDQPRNSPSWASYRLPNAGLAAGPLVARTRRAAGTALGAPLGAFPRRG
jgi:hypothetical protein